MTSSNKKVVAVLPAYNAAKTLAQTVGDIPRQFVDAILLVDDCSSDETVAIANALGLITFVHDENRGYGANQKTCYEKALALSADVVVMVHPDHQYDPLFIPQLVMPIVTGEFDAVFGSRMIWKGKALEGGMPYWKYLANITLTKLENAVLGLRLTEYHSGFRAYSRRVLEALPLHLNSDDFVFDTEIIVQLKVNNFKIKEVPITTRYFKEASSIGIWSSIRYGVHILLVMLRYFLTRIHLRRSPQFRNALPV